VGRSLRRWGQEYYRTPGVRDSKGGKGPVPQGLGAPGICPKPGVRDSQAWLSLTRRG
jgi:hypothetical protein